MPLTKAQRDRLAKSPNIPIDTVINYIQKGEIELSEIKDPNRRALIEQRIASMPNPIEQQQWEDIKRAYDSPAQDRRDLITIIDKYIDTWVTSRPEGNHVDEAKNMKAGIIDQLSAAEQKEWEALDVFSKKSMLEYLKKYPETCHLSEIDDNYWGLASAGNNIDDIKDYLLHFQNGRHVNDANTLIDNIIWGKVNKNNIVSLNDFISNYPQSAHIGEAKELIDDIDWASVNIETVKSLNDYIDKHPQGKHVKEARDLLNALSDWLEVKRRRNIIEVNDYIKLYPECPYIRPARLLLLELKENELSKMKDAPQSYDILSLKKLLEEEIFTQDDLMNEGVVTRSVLNTILNTDPYEDLPDINKAIEESHADCKPDFTDVFFFGIPSTGKTCVLMGLSRSNHLDINLASGGGDYAAALQQYTYVGITVPRTPGNFVTTLESKIMGKPGGKGKGDEAIHNVNLVEMSGEEFAYQIAHNIQHEFSFEDMGTGATALLSNGNRKVFFLIIDPTADKVKIKRNVATGEVDEETGDYIYITQTIHVDQRQTLKKMVDIMAHPSNSEIMKNVDAIHFIMTKADRLGETYERAEKANMIFKDKYLHIIQPLIELSRTYSINVNYDYSPKLYTFSLGTFYIGGIYEYEERDSNELVKAIREATWGVKKQSLWDKIKAFVN